MYYKNESDFCKSILDDYKKLKLDEVEIVHKKIKNLSVKSRNVKLENIERAKSSIISITLYKGKKKSNLTLNNIDKIKTIDILERGSDMLNSLPDDIYSGLPEKNQYASKIPDLDIFDKSEEDESKLMDYAFKAETKMLENQKVTNTEGSGVSSSKNEINIYSSKGFIKGYKKTINSSSAVAIAGRDTNMQRDYDYHSVIHKKDLPKPEIVGKKAGERAVSRLNAKKIKSCTLDVVFDPRVAKSILSSFSSCITGASIARGTSFLLNKRNTLIFNENINIINKPHLYRGIGSVPYDYNGVKNNDIFIVKNGKLVNFFLSSRSARQLKEEPNGNSMPYNLTLEAGDIEVKDMISSINKGFYITEMLGMSFNPVNGDYSRGAAGFLIENGEISYPVSEVTIADNMNNMLKKLTPAKDLKMIENINTPTILIEKMTLAGL